MADSSEFKDFFEKYRLESGYTTYASFGQALAKEGFVYEDSIFSKWKTGERVPRDRRTILALLKIFIRAQAIKNVTEANTILAILDHRNLNAAEEELVGTRQEIEPYSEFAPWVEPSFLFQDVMPRPENTRFDDLSDTSNDMREYWLYQARCMVADYYAKVSGGKKDASEIFQLLGKDPYDQAGVTATVVAITTDKETGQEYLCGLARVIHGSTLVDPPLNFLNYLATKTKWPHDAVDISRVGELDRYIVPNWVWEARQFLTSHGFDAVAQVAQRFGCEYFYAIKFDFMAKICNDVGILMQEISDAVPIDHQPREDIVYPIIYTDTAELKLFWQVKHKLYRYIGRENQT